jgi:hypothetical protein
MIHKKISFFRIKRVDNLESVGYQPERPDIRSTMTAMGTLIAGQKNLQAHDRGDLLIS